MQLTLQPRPTAQRATGAAFVRGADPAAWLAEIGRWGVPAEALACYVVPESIQSPQPAGLLVVALVPDALAAADCLEPYGVVAGRLYVPTHAALWPATDDAELSAALLWPRQLQHPRIGLVGFDMTDELPLAALLTLPPLRPTDWSRAHPAAPPRPRLHQIRVQRPTAEQVLEAFKESIGSEPLTELPGQVETTPLQRLLDNLRRGALKTGLDAVQGLGDLASGLAGAGSGGGSAGTGAAGGTASGAGGPGPLARLQQWLTENLDDLEKKRHAELNRLLELFGENPDEALKYAIPLGGPYFSRGTATPSARLGPRSTQFNLGQLGGGQAVDGWDLGGFEQTLRTRYETSARAETAAGRFTKAAYIYAHLLGDYHAAANVLEQGGHFREAAALHLDHLRNRRAAAACLERGGLLLDAAELYETLGSPEKAADLYQQIEQPARAAALYEQSVAWALSHHDYPDAARLLAHKLHAPDRAQHALLEGWTNSSQAETCLKQYFELVAEHGGPAALPAQVRAVHQHRTPPAQRGRLLHVLAGLAEQHSDADLRAAVQDVGYEVLSADAQTGSLTHLPLLRRLLPDDWLIAADASRFVTTQRARRPQSDAAATADEWQLDARLTWVAAVSYRSQFLAAGWHDGHAHLARGNWFGHVEYYSWPVPVAESATLRLVADALHSHTVVLRSSDGAVFEPKTLPKNKHFDEALTVHSAAWLPRGEVGVALLPNNEVATLTAGEKGVTVHRYDAAGVLLDSFTPALLPGQEFGHPQFVTTPEMIFRDEHYYTFRENQLLVFARQQEPQVLYAESFIYQMAASAYVLERVVLCTENGCQLWGGAMRQTLHDTPLFATEHGLVSDAQFVSADCVVVAAGAAATVFQFDPAGQAAALRTVTAPAPVVAVLPTAHRGRFALLEDSGRLSLHAVHPTP